MDSDEENNPREKRKERVQKMLTPTVWWISVAGCAFFALALVFVLVAQDSIRERAREFLAKRVHEETLFRDPNAGRELARLVVAIGRSEPGEPIEIDKVQLDEPSDDKEPGLGAALKDRLSDLQQKAAENAPAAFDKALGKDPETREKLSELIDENLDLILEKTFARPASSTNRLQEAMIETIEEKSPLLGGIFKAFVLTSFKQRVEELDHWQRTVEDDHAKTVDHLIHELALFCLMNLAVYAVVLAGLRLTDPRKLALPALVMILATLTVCGFYFLGQDWFNSIMYDRYWGWSFLGYVGVVLLMTIDFRYLNGTLTSVAIQAFGMALEIVITTTLALVAALAGAG